MIILDSDVLIEMIDKKSKLGEEALENVSKSGDTISTTVINLHEVLFGLLKREKSTGQLTSFPILGYNREDAVLSAELELSAERRGSAIRRTDSMIAAIVINNNAKLYTLDKRHFKQLEHNGLELFQ